MKTSLVIFTFFHTEMYSERKLPTQNFRSGDKQSKIKQESQNKSLPHLGNNSPSCSCPNQSTAPRLPRSALPLHFNHFSWSFCSVVFIAFAYHAKGHPFKTRQKHPVRLNLMVRFNDPKVFFQPKWFCASGLQSTHFPASPFAPCPYHLSCTRTSTPTVHYVGSSFRKACLQKGGRSCGGEPTFRLA